MILSKWRYILSLLCLTLVLSLASCGANNTQTKPATLSPASPTPVQAQQLLQSTAHQLNTAKTLHGIFNLTISGQTINGNTSNEVWNESPSKSRTVVLQSSIAQIATGTATVSDGKQIWQYDPQKQVVYHGTIPANTNGTARVGQQNQFLNLARNIFTQSTGTLGSQVSINRHNTYDVHIVPSNAQSTYDYTGDAYIDKTTTLPVRVKLTIQNTGQVQLDFATLTLNQPIASQTFAFTIPTGVKVLPLQAANSASGTAGALTLSQAQQQAGYHLLSILGNQSGYTLQSVTALGAPGSQIYTLNYMKGTTGLTISEGKPLANLPAIGQSENLRGTTGTLTNENGATTLSWTEKGVGIRISSQLDSQQITQVALLLT